MQIKEILFPIDFSDQNLSLNSQVEWLAWHFDARVTLLHVFEIPAAWYGSAEVPILDPGYLKDFSDAAQNRLNNYKIDLPAEQVRRIMLDGGVASNICDWVRANSVDLIVMGTHGYGALRRMLLGSVAMRLLHELDCPVWTLNSTTTRLSGLKQPISKILCAIDFRPETLALLHYAKDFAAACEATVQLIHSIPEIETLPGRYYDTEFHQELRRVASRDISRLQAEAGTNFGVTIGNGPFGADIVERAAQHRCDLIIVGRGKMQSTFGGLRTHAYDIIREAQCPVLSVSMKSEQAPGDLTQSKALEAVSGV